MAKAALSRYFWVCARGALIIEREKLVCISAFCPEGTLCLLCQSIRLPLSLSHLGSSNLDRPAACQDNKSNVCAGLLDLTEREN